MKKNTKTILCPKCKGNRNLINRGEQSFTAVATLGLLPVLDFIFRESDEDSIYAYECKRCEGKGTIEI